MKRPLCLLAALAIRILTGSLVVSGLTQAARAHTSETLEGLALTNFVGWLVNSDALNGNAGYDRYTLKVNATHCAVSSKANHCTRIIWPRSVSALPNSPMPQP